MVCRMDYFVNYLFKNRVKIGQGLLPKSNTKKLSYSESQIIWILRTLC